MQVRLRTQGKEAGQYSHNLRQIGNYNSSPALRSSTKGSAEVKHFPDKDQQGFPARSVVGDPHKPVAIAGRDRASGAATTGRCGISRADDPARARNTISAFSFVYKKEACAAGSEEARARVHMDDNGLTAAVLCFPVRSTFEPENGRGDRAGAVSERLVEQRLADERVGPIRSRGPVLPGSAFAASARRFPALWPRALG